MMTTGGVKEWIRPFLWIVLILEIAILFYLRYPWTVGDTGHYMELAHNISTRNNFSSMTPDGIMPEALRSPGYPIFLSLFLILGIPNSVIVLVQIAMYVFCIYACERYLIDDRIGKSIFLAISTLYIFPLIYAINIASEALTLFLVTLAVIGNNVRASEAILIAYIKGNI